MTPLEAVELYVRTSGRLRSKDSVAAYRNIFLRLPNRAIQTLSEQDLVTFCYSGDPSPNTIRQRRTVLRSVLEWLHWAGHIAHNPAANLKLAVPVKGGPVRHHNWLGPEDRQAVLDCFDREDFVGARNRFIVALGFYAGLRRSEIGRLTWGSFTNQGLRVVGKGNKPATLGVLPRLQRELDDWFKAYIVERGNEPHNTDPLIPRVHQGIHPDGHWFRHPCWDVALGPQGVYHVLKWAEAETGLTGLSPHDLRRTFVKILVDSGVPPEDAQKMTRHANLATYSAYVEKNTSRTTRLMEALKVDL